MLLFSIVVAKPNPSQLEPRVWKTRDLQLAWCQLCKLDVTARDSNPSIESTGGIEKLSEQWDCGNWKQRIGEKACELRALIFLHFLLGIKEMKVNPVNFVEGSYLQSIHMYNRYHVFQLLPATGTCMYNGTLDWFKRSNINIVRGRELMSRQMHRFTLPVGKENFTAS